ncbi:MAG: hypothetical protein R3E12_16110 [Candidatus Eisenbacteria bacterium]
MSTPQHLDRYAAIEVGVPREVDDAGGTPTELTFDLVSTQVPGRLRSRVAGRSEEPVGSQGGVQQARQLLVQSGIARLQSGQPSPALRFREIHEIVKERFEIAGSFVARNHTIDSITGP